MSKIIFGLDLGSNSLGWAVLDADENEKPIGIKDAGVRIFPKAVEDKTPTPKNQQRRNSRLARRTIQRRARRKQRLLNYLVSLQLLPKDLLEESHPEGILNSLGDPYQLRAKALDKSLTPHELGRALLHLVQRRGFLSNKKTLLGRDMLDDPDVLAVLGEEDQSESGSSSREKNEKEKEESAFKADISRLRDEIKTTGCRTLGEFLATKPQHECKRNRDGQHLRTDRQMYREELALIFERQAPVHAVLTSEVRKKIEHIIFHQRPLKLKQDRVGKCSLEPRNKRAAIARLEYQRFRYLQDINNLRYLDPYTDQWQDLADEDRRKLVDLFEINADVTFPKIRKTLGMDRKTTFNLDTGVKKLRGNTTVAAILSAYPGWSGLTDKQQYALVDDLLSIKKKSALKQRLINHWQLDGAVAVKLCLVELEPDYGSVSLKAIRRLLPYLDQGMIYSDARKAAGYGYDETIETVQDKLGQPPALPNPIVNKGLHELRRVVNALIGEYGKPDVIRIEMARDLEMNTDRYKAFVKQQEKNTKANDKAVEAWQDEARKNPGMGLSKYPSRDDKIRYRLWVDQNHCCAYSCQPISLGALFSANVEVDHIIPYSQSLDDSYMNKVVCFAKENQNKGQRTPIDAFGGNEEKWNQISQALSNWGKAFPSKRGRFYKHENELDSDFINNQLTDTRYISKEAGNYLKTLGVDITYTKGVLTSWLRHQWKLNDLIGETDKKERSDHRHHTIDAVVTACIDRRLYNTMVAQAKSLERSGSAMSMKELYITPPMDDIKARLQERLEQLIVSHVPQRKITGALHEDTGVGFIEGKGTVYRKRLDKEFTAKNAESIVDEQVKKIVLGHLEKYNNDPKKAFADDVTVFHQDGKTPVKRVRVLQSKTTLEKRLDEKFTAKKAESIVDEQVKKIVLGHLEKYNNDPKKAFADGVTVFHKDGKTPINRVRVLQSKTTLEKLQKSKFPIKNSQGDVFKWHAYGNTHHVEIFRHRVKQDKYTSHFVTAMEAAQRVRSKQNRQALIQTDHGDGWEFIMALHINDLVEVVVNEKVEIHRIQKLNMTSSQIVTRLHTSATVSNEHEGLIKSVTTLIKDYQMKRLSVNAIGKRLE